MSYDETTRTWEATCQVHEVHNSSVTVKTRHMSTFKLGDIPNVPPPDFSDSDGDCSDNYSPVYCLIGLACVSLILLILMVLTDRIQEKNSLKSSSVKPESGDLRHTERGMMNDVSHVTNVTFMVQPPNSPKCLTPIGNIADLDERFREKNLETDQEGKLQINTENPAGQNDFTDNEMEIDDKEFEVSDKESEIDAKSEHTENSCVGQIESSIKIEDLEKITPYGIDCIKLLEGHLTFGLYIYRKDFARWLRVLIISSVLVFQLLIEGLLFHASTDYNSGTENTSTNSIFDDYKGEYFGYMFLALVISMPIEICMSIVLSMDRSKSPGYVASGIMVGVVI